ncbi:MAG: NYN domain-containing protein, partial [Pyrinomonadaceae bacterium]
YAERNSNADERIKKLVDESRERKTLTVVTSDRALGDYVRRCGVTVMRSGEFRKRMEELAGGSDAFAAEPTPLAEEELPEWMRYFGVAPEDDDA